MPEDLQKVPKTVPKVSKRCPKGGSKANEDDLDYTSDTLTMTLFMTRTLTVTMMITMTLAVTMICMNAYDCQTPLQTQM